MSEELGLAQFVDWVSDVKQLVELALAQFGDAWHKDNVNYTWLHKNWSHTRDRPRPNTWGTQIKQLERDVRKALTALSPPPGPRPAESHRSRSPRRDPQAHQLEVPQASQVSQSSGGSGSGEQTRKQAIVDSLMANTAAELLDSSDWSAASHVPLETMDKWIRELHKAVDASPLCSWPRVMKPTDQGIQSLGIATLNYGYRFKFRFQDNECGDLLFHGAPVGSVFEILRGNFRPRRTGTLQAELLASYGCVPPLVWFSALYSCAAWYPQHMSLGQFALGEPLAHDAPQPVRMVFHTRVNKSERLAHKHKGNNDQHAFSPESVLSIVGLDVIATCFSLTSVHNRHMMIWPTVHLKDYFNMDFLAAKLSEILGDAIVPRPPWADVPFDPRGLHTKSTEELTRLANLVKSREMLLQDQRELVAFHASIVRGDGEWNSDNMGKLVQWLSERVRSLLVKGAEASEPQGMSTTEAAQDIVSSQLNSEELASIPSSGRELGKFLGTKALKKYKAKLRKAKAKDYTDKCEVYETACPDPIVAPEITEPAVSSKMRVAQLSSLGFVYGLQVRSDAVVGKSPCRGWHSLTGYLSLAPWGAPSGFSAEQGFEMAVRDHISL